MGLPLLDLPLPTLPPALALVVHQGDERGFREQLQLARQARGWDAETALLQAHASLQLGLDETADDLVLEADAIAPEWSLVPDRWGLWPAPAPTRQASAEQRQRCERLVEDYLLLRHRPALELWRSWLAAVQQQWQRAAAPSQLGVMGLLLGRLEQLPAPLEPALEQLIGEEQVAADPAAALAVWGPISRRRPSWTYARLKAADLCLRQHQLNACAEHLAGATAEQRQLPWLHDIEARLAMARQQPREALRHWEEAIRLAGSDGDEELAELFRQRRREAEWDAEWMAAPAMLQGASGDAALDRFAEKIQTWAQRAGVDLSNASASGEADPEGFSRYLDQASGRLALAG